MRAGPYVRIVRKYTDRNASKRRSALVVSSVAFNRDHRQTILSMITSAPGEWPSDVIIRGWREAGLTAPCKVRLKPFTLDDDLVVRKLGSLTPRDRQAAGSAFSHGIATG